MLAKILACKQFYPFSWESQATLQYTYLSLGGGSDFDSNEYAVMRNLSVLSLYSKIMSNQSDNDLSFFEEGGQSLQRQDPQAVFLRRLQYSAEHALGYLAMPSYQGRSFFSVAYGLSCFVRSKIAHRTLQLRLTFYDVSTQKAIRDSKEAIVDVVVNHIETGAMSLGAMSEQSHNDLSEGVNRSGSRSNSGEGGLQEGRFDKIDNPQIVQRASGVWGNSLSYFLHADEIQIKVAQGAKPGEGGHLPPGKVNATIAGIRRVREGSTLISPQPMHDVYSIEDLFYLIHSLKSMKPGMLISVKLVSDPHVAITALGAAKAGADRIIIAGGNGGTGAAKYSSIFNTGFPWELGISETHKLFKDLGIRDCVELVASGGIRTGRDIVTAHLLGANKVEMGTSFLVALGCIMLRKCHSQRSVSVSDIERELAKEKKLAKDTLKEASKQVYDALVEAGYIEFETGEVTLLLQKEEARLSHADSYLTGTIFSGLNLDQAYIDSAFHVLKKAPGGCTKYVNTQDEAYKNGYDGAPEKVMDLMFFLGYSVSRILKDELGQQRLSDIVGRGKEYLQPHVHNRVNGLMKLLSPLQPSRFQGFLKSSVRIPCQKDIDCIELLKAHIDAGRAEQALQIDLFLQADDFSFGVALSSFCLKHAILTPIEICLFDEGQLGPQNLACWLHHNITISISGTCNDHGGKGLSGGHFYVSGCLGALSELLPYVRAILFDSDSNVDGDRGLQNKLEAFRSFLDDVESGDYSLAFLKKAHSVYQSLLAWTGAKGPDADRIRAEILRFGTVVVGNQWGFGAMAGQLFVNGVCGSRTCIRFSGADAVIIDAKKYLCEFMTSGQVLVLGELGAEFAVGMTGGFVYVDKSIQANQHYFKTKRFLAVSDYPEHEKKVLQMLQAFCDKTGSLLAEDILIHWNKKRCDFYVHYPYFLNDLLVSDYENESLQKTYQVMNDVNIGWPFSHYLNQKSKQEKPVVPLKLMFDGDAGKGFGFYCHRWVSLSIRGSVGDCFGQGSHGELVVSGQDLPCAVGRDALYRGAGRVYVAGKMGAYALQEFSGTAVLDSVGPYPFRRLSDQAFVIVLGELSDCLDYDERCNGRVYVLSKPETGHLDREVILKIREECKQYLDKTKDTRYEWLRDKIEDDTFVATSFRTLPRHSVSLDSSKSDTVDVELFERMKASGWTKEGLESIVDMIGDEATYSMGDQSNSLEALNYVSGFHFFKQPFAQETRPPIDKGSEGRSISTDIYLGGHINNATRLIHLDSPILTIAQLEQIKNTLPCHECPMIVDLLAFKTVRELKDALFDRVNTIKESLKKIIANSEGYDRKRVLILYHHDGGLHNRNRVTALQCRIPSWLLVATVRSFIDREGLDLDIIIDSDELLGPHEVDVLLNYGAKAVCPRGLQNYLEGHSLNQTKRDRGLDNGVPEKVEVYRHAIVEALKRIMAKNGDTNVISRCNSRTYDALYLNQDVANYMAIRTHFPSEEFSFSFILSQMGQAVLNPSKSIQETGKYKFKRDGISQNYSNKTVSLLQQALTEQGTHDFDIESIGKKISLKSYLDYENETQECGKMVSSYFQLKPLRKTVCIIGDGPSAIRCANLLVDKGYFEDIVVVGKNPFVGGKVSYAVAPDHRETKGWLEKEVTVFLKHTQIDYVGGVKVDASLFQDIVARFSYVVLATGAKTRRLSPSMPGESRVVYGSQVVSWYNSKPYKGDSDSHRPSPLSLASRSVFLYGQGNVVLDIARILARDPEKIKPFLADSVYESLASSRLETIETGGRRFPFETRFSLHELKQLESLRAEGELNIHAEFDSSQVEQVYYERVSKLILDCIVLESELNALQVALQGDADIMDQHDRDAIQRLKTRLEQACQSRDAMFYQRKIMDIFLFWNRLSQGNNSKRTIVFKFGITMDERKGLLKCGQDQREVLLSYNQDGEEREAIYGDVVVCIGSKKHIPFADYLSISEEGDVSVTTQKGDFPLQFMSCVGQASTQRGTIADSNQSVDTVIKKIDAVSDQLKPVVSASQWIQDRFPDRFSKDDLNVMTTMVVKPVSWQGYRDYLLLSRYNRLFLEDVPSNTTYFPYSSSTPIKEVPEDTRPRSIAFNLLEGNQVRAWKPVRSVDVRLSVRDQFKETTTLTVGSCSVGTCGECAYKVKQGHINNVDPTNFKLAKKMLKGKEGQFGLGCQTLIKDLDSNCDTKLLFLSDVDQFDENVIDTAFKDVSDCGLGMMVSSKESSTFLQQALHHLRQDVSRGSGLSGFGDGAGVMLSLDRTFFISQVMSEMTGTASSELDFQYVKTSFSSTWGIVQFFLGENDQLEKIQSRLLQRGLEVFYVRLVPMDHKRFVLEHREHAPVYQFFIKKKEALDSEDDFQSRVVAIQRSPFLIMTDPENLCSISSQYVTYKLAAYSCEMDVFSDFDPIKGMKAKYVLTHARFSTTTTPKPGKAHPIQNLIHNGEILTKQAMVQFLLGIEKKLSDRGIAFKKKELLNGSDSYVLQRYVNCLKVYLEEICQFELSLGTVFHIIMRPDGGNAILNEYSKALGIPTVSGPCNVAMFGHVKNKDVMVFSRDSSGFRPAMLSIEENSTQIVSSQYCPREDQQLLEEGGIYCVELSSGQCGRYDPERMDPNFLSFARKDLKSKIVMI